MERIGLVTLKALWRLSQGRTLVGNLFKGTLRFLVGRGDQILFWNGLWLGDRLLREIPKIV